MIYFRIILSGTKDTVILNETEAKDVISRIKQLRGPGFITIKQGIFNPAYLVAILEDKRAGMGDPYLKRMGFGGNENTKYTLSKVRI